MTSSLRRTVSIAVLALAVILLATAPAKAHRANVFAWAEGDVIKVEASFSGGRAAMNAPVEVQDAASGGTLTTVTTDKEGNCSFPIPDAARDKRMDLRIVLLAGQGHKGEWVITAEEYLGDAPDSPTPAEAGVASPSPASTLPASMAGEINEARLEEMVARAVSREIAPMRRSLAAMSDGGPTAKDVFGGIGYILGLFGIAAWMKSRKAGQ